MKLFLDVVDDNVDLVKVEVYYDFVKEGFLNVFNGNGDVVMEELGGLVKKEFFYGLLYEMVF